MNPKTHRFVSGMLGNPMQRGFAQALKLWLKVDEDVLKEKVRLQLEAAYDPAPDEPMVDDAMRMIFGDE